MFPMLEGDSNKFSAEHTCAWCNQDKVSEPNSMAILTGGAMLVNRRTGNGGPDPRLDGYLDLFWHGAHTEDGGQGDYPDISERIVIASAVVGGQFDILFCSTKCLRAFLNHAVDQLEDKITTASEVDGTT